MDKRGKHPKSQANLLNLDRRLEAHEVSQAFRVRTNREVAEWFSGLTAEERGEWLQRLYNATEAEREREEREALNARIRAEWATGKYENQKALARAFGMRDNAISMLIGSQVKSRKRFEENAGLREVVLDLYKIHSHLPKKDFNDLVVVEAQKRYGEKRSRSKITYAVRRIRTEIEAKPQTQSNLKLKAKTPPAKQAPVTPKRKPTTSLAAALAEVREQQKQEQERSGKKK